MYNEDTIKIEQKHLPMILTIGLIISAIMIIFSVEYYFQNKKYIELAISTIVFSVIVLTIRRLNN